MKKLAHSASRSVWLNVPPQRGTKHIRDSRIVENGGNTGGGGGLSIGDGSTLTMEDSVVSGNGAVYAAPSTLSTTATNRLTKVASVPGRITAGDWAPDGVSYMVRTQINGYLYDSLDDTQPTVSA